LLPHFNFLSTPKIVTDTALQSGPGFLAHPAEHNIGPLYPTQICVQLPMSAVNVTLLAFAAERRAAAPLLWAPGACRARRLHCRSISPADMALSSKPAAHRGCGRMMTYRQTDARSFHRPCSAYYASSVNNSLQATAKMKNKHPICNAFVYKMCTDYNSADISCANHFPIPVNVINSTKATLETAQMHN